MEKAAIEAEHLCIKCGCSGFDDEMITLCKEGERDFVSAWAHRECLAQYRMIAAPFEMALIQSKMVDPHRRRT
jgi:hypothetical protein